MVILHVICEAITTEYYDYSEVLKSCQVGLLHPLEQLCVRDIASLETSKYISGILRSLIFFSSCFVLSSRSLMPFASVMPCASGLSLPHAVPLSVIRSFWITLCRCRRSLHPFRSNYFPWGIESETWKPPSWGDDRRNKHKGARRSHFNRDLNVFNSILHLELWCIHDVVSLRIPYPKRLHGGPEGTIRAPCARASSKMPEFWRLGLIFSRILEWCLQYTAPLRSSHMQDDTVVRCSCESKSMKSRPSMADPTIYPSLRSRLLSCSLLLHLPTEVLSTHRRTTFFFVAPPSAEKSLSLAPHTAVETSRIVLNPDVHEGRSLDAEAV